jgi:hypothetical protein
MDKLGLYADPFEEVKKERARILKNIPGPCPPDFPEQLRPFWKGHLEELRSKRG